MKTFCRKDTKMKDVDIATLIVSLAQIIGLIVTVTWTGPVAAVISGIAGFAAIVNLFLPTGPSATWYKKLKFAAAICGVGLIVYAVMKVA